MTSKKLNSVDKYHALKASFGYKKPWGSNGISPSYSIYISWNPVWLVGWFSKRNVYGFWIMVIGLLLPQFLHLHMRLHLLPDRWHEHRVVLQPVWLQQQPLVFTVCTESGILLGSNPIPTSSIPPMTPTGPSHSRENGINGPPKKLSI